MPAFSTILSSKLLSNGVSYHDFAGDERMAFWEHSAFGKGELDDDDDDAAMGGGDDD